jgi:hypothetical protein
MRRVQVLFAILTFFWSFASPRAQAKVFYSKQEALRLAFPEAEDIEKRTFFLSDEQVKRVERLARSRPESKLATFYIGKKRGQIIGYAMIDIRNVRTLPEALMVVLSTEGEVVSTLILAFYEPPEYLPTDRWLEQFDQKTLTPDLWPGRDIAAITGATLTVNAVTRAVREILALYQVLIARM